MKAIPDQNKKLVLEAFDTLFNRRDYAAAEKFWSPNYIQHSAHIEPGREGLFNLIKNLPATLKWTHGVILAEDDVVIVHSRYSGHGLPAPWIVADIVRIRTEFWPNTGTSSRTKPPKSNQRVVCRCLALHSPSQTVNLPPHH